MPWYAGKGEIRKYLQELNKDKEVSSVGGKTSPKPELT